jgi:hypothetical protein
LAGPAEWSQFNESLVHKPTVMDPELLLVKETRIPSPVLNDKVVPSHAHLIPPSFPDSDHLN